jgi:hypothetical protein
VLEDFRIRRDQDAKFALLFGLAYDLAVTLEKKISFRCRVLLGFIQSGVSRGGESAKAYG